MGIAKDFSPDVIVTYGGPETFLARLLPRHPPILRFRGQELNAAPQALEWARARLDHVGIAAVISPARQLADKLARSATKGARPFVVPIGLDTEKFYLPQPVPGRPDVATALVFGRFDPVKGHARLLRAWQSMLRTWSGRKPQLWIIGEPANTSLAELTALCQTLGLVEGQDVVVRDERLPDPAKVLSGVHLGVVPSLGSETIARVAQEFLLCGTAVLVSGAGSLPEVLHQPEFGRCFGDADDAELGRALGQSLEAALHETPTMREQRARSAQALFSLAAMGEGLQRVIDRALAGA